jgi:citrate lyase subunit beta/citryl-CoA lyase
VPQNRLDQTSQVLEIRTVTEPSRPIRRRRSELSTPATNEKMMAKAATGDADLVFLDLEDAVAPNAKDVARTQAADALTNLDWSGKARAVRVNGIRTPWFYDDITEVVSKSGHALDVIILPKAKSEHDVRFVDTLIGRLEQKYGLEPGVIGLEVLIEEVEALGTIDAIAACSPRLEALILGVGDLAASHGMRSAHIGVSAAYPGDIWHSARTKLIVAARSNGLDPIDGPFGEFRVTDAYREQCVWAAELGAVGKWAIHPNQVGVANDVFSPTPEEIAHAQSVVSGLREAEARGEGAVAIDGNMVDAATARIFETVLYRASVNGQI